jgi:hypothetical protein
MPITIRFCKAAHQVSHTSHPEKVWLQTIDLLYSPQFSGCSHDAAEVLTRTRLEKVAKSFICEGEPSLIMCAAEVIVQLFFKRRSSIVFLELLPVRHS